MYPEAIHPETEALPVRNWTAQVDPAGQIGVGVCSTRPSATTGTLETGCDTLAVLFETAEFGDPVFEISDAPGWKFLSYPSHGVIKAEGHPTPGALASADDCMRAARHIRGLVDDRFGVIKDQGVGRIDLTATAGFGRPPEARAFITGMAAITLPRTETTRRGNPVHSVSYSDPRGRKILARVYDKGLERGGEPWEFVRAEDQRRYRKETRLPIEVVADPDWMRGRHEARFGPVRKVVDGVKAATFEVHAQAIADEVKFGLLTPRQAERRAGALVILRGGAGDAYPTRTRYRRQQELRDAGIVICEDVEAVEVDLGETIDRMLEESEWR